MIKLGINIDHFATIRNTRHTYYPDMVRAAVTSIKAGADFVTIHLREDRRHIIDADVYAIRNALRYNQLNLEVAATDEMINIVNDVKPYYVCLVPEKRNELTTEGGLDLLKIAPKIENFIAKTKGSVAKTTLFLDPDINQINIAKQIGVTSIEVHTGKYAEISSEENFAILEASIKKITDYGLECNAGHGLTFETAAKVSTIQGITTLHIGHFIVAESLFIGLEECIAKMIRAIGR